MIYYPCEGKSRLGKSDFHILSVSHRQFLRLVKLWQQRILNGFSLLLHPQILERSRLSLVFIYTWSSCETFLISMAFKRQQGACLLEKKMSSGHLHLLIVEIIWWDINLYSPSLIQSDKGSLLISSGEGRKWSLKTPWKSLARICYKVWLAATIVSANV